MPKAKESTVTNKDIQAVKEELKTLIQEKHGSIYKFMKDLEIKHGLSWSAMQQSLSPSGGVNISHYNLFYKELGIAKTISKKVESIRTVTYYEAVSN